MAIGSGRFSNMFGALEGVNFFISRAVFCIARSVCIGGE